MEPNLKGKMYSQKKLIRFLSSAFMFITILYTVHNLFITNPSVFDIISMRMSIKELETEIKSMEHRKEKLKKELKNLREEINILKKERGAFDEEEYIIIYENKSP